ncbi:MAG TPA: hypothetical protein PKD95_02675 [Candidatus Paceibacterota bacterium]|nr:hypothetical protein [Candidatus Paceibacterota bacterium]
MLALARCLCAGAVACVASAALFSGVELRTARGRALEARLLTEYLHERRRIKEIRLNPHVRVRATARTAEQYCNQ